jgi:hypothetical protein
LAEKGFAVHEMVKQSDAVTHLASQRAALSNGSR